VKAQCYKTAIITISNISVLKDSIIFYLTFETYKINNLATSISVKDWGKVNLGRVGSED
jgi:hypothetical protein